MVQLRYYVAALTLALAVFGSELASVHTEGVYGGGSEELSPCGKPYEVVPEGGCNCNSNSNGWTTAILESDMAFYVKGLACGGSNPDGRSCPGPRPSLPYGSMCVKSETAEERTYSSTDSHHHCSSDGVPNTDDRSPCNFNANNYPSSDPDNDTCFSGYSNPNNHDSSDPNTNN